MLRSRIKGVVLEPGNPAFESTSQPWNTAIHQSPAAVVLPDAGAIAEDVSATMQYAEAHGLHVAVQGTGHGATGRVDSNTILIVTSHLSDVRIAESQAIVQPGAKWSHLVGPAGARGLAGLAGSSSDVGILGYTLGGGLGWLGRSHGLACNAVTQAQLVTPNGEVLTLNHQQNPDLFWAIRGGLANFGVITELHIALVPLSNVQAGYLTYPAEQAVEVLEAACAWAMDLPDSITSTTMVVNPPSGAFAYIGLCCSDHSFDVADALKPLDALGPPLRNTVKVMPVAELGEIHLDPLEPAASVSDARLVNWPIAMHSLAPELPGQGNPLALMEFRRLGGAIARSDPRHGALDCLDGDFLLFCLGIEGATGTRHEISATFDRVAHAMGSPGGTALNFVDDPISARSELTPVNYRRLQNVRQLVDPTDRMRASHPIDLDPTGP